MLQQCVVLDHDGDHTLSRPAQGEGVGGALGDEAEAEVAGQGVELVGQGDDDAGRRLRQVVAGTPGQVVLVDGRGHRRVLPLQSGVLPTHDALQLREFVDHGRGQVSLAQVRRPLRVRRIDGVEPDEPGNLLHQALDPLHLLVECAELLLEHDVLQLLVAGPQPDPAVLVEEETGIGQAGPQHLLVAGPDGIQVRIQAVADGDEVGQQPPAGGVVHREVALVLPHRSHQDLFGDFQVGGVEGAGKGPGLLHQPGDLLQQVWVRLHHAAQVPGHLPHLLPDHVLPHALVDQDVSVADLLEVVAGVEDQDRLRWRQEAVPKGGGAGGDAVDVEGDPAVAQQGQEPSDRPGEADGAAAPAHALGELQGEHQVLQQVGQHQTDGAAHLHPPGEDVVGVALPGDIHLLRRDALGAHEALQGFGRLALGVISDAGRGALGGHLQVVLLCGHRLDQQHQAPGRAEGLDLAVEEAGGVQRHRRLALQLLQGRHAEAGRQFLRANLQEEVTG